MSALVEEQESKVSEKGKDRSPDPHFLNNTSKRSGVEDMCYCSVDGNEK